MYLKLKQHPFSFIGRFSKVFQKFKRAPMLHFQYVFTEIKTQTSSLILFLELTKKKNSSKTTDMRHASHKDFLFIAVERERQVFYRCQQNEKS